MYTTKLNRISLIPTIRNKVMRCITLLLMLTPITAQAECGKLTEYLNKKHPGRILVQSYGYTLQRLVIFEQLKTDPGSTISVVECIENRYKTVNSFRFSTDMIADMEYDEMEGAVIVIFSIDPEKVGFIEKQEDKYIFNEGLYER